MRPLRPTVRSLPLRPVGCLQALFEAIEALLPERTVLLEPFGRLAEVGSVQTRRPQLRRAPACDQPGPLEHLEVLGHSLNGDRERLGELVHRRLPVCEASEDRTPGRVRKSGKRLCELVDRHSESPPQLLRTGFVHPTGLSTTPLSMVPGRPDGPGCKRVRRIV